MDSRSSGIAAILVGIAVFIVALNEYVYPVMLPEPFVSGLFITALGILLILAGSMELVAQHNHLPLQFATGVGLLTLAGVVFTPESLLFGGIFWNAMVAFALVSAGVFPTIRSFITSSPA